jgi:hypothetical protein
MSTAEAVAENSATEVAATSASVDCVIHVRFNPNGTVAEIGQRPAGATDQQWFNFLSRNTLNRYEAYAGGRGVFKLPKAQAESLKVECVAEATS